MWVLLGVFCSGLMVGYYVRKGIEKRRSEEILKQIDAEQEAGRELRQQKYAKDKTFKQIFYNKVDEMLTCRELKELQPGIEYLIYFSEQIDGVEIFQPLRGFNAFELEHFLYGLLNWRAIKSLIVAHGKIKQVDIIKEINLDKDKAGFFLYTLDKMGVLKKEKQGRYNVYSFVTEQISGNTMKNSWNLFSTSGRLPTE